ncbi:hypothetical protein HRbin06_00530 [archaeon HR06]|nr:hypothetical protein HRbin06_00530 [archaeon HR06]
MDSLEKVAKEVENCKLCELHKFRRKAVPGEGNKEASIMLIGEAPGSEEDYTGRPFVGSAGRLLNEILKKVGINREDVFITNVVKCRPPKNRVPRKDEIESCRTYLERQISLINPKIIFLLGSTALEALLNKKSVSNFRGKIIKKKGRLYMVTYHPASALYNPKFRIFLEEDFKRLKDLLPNLEMGKIDYYIE